MTSMKNTESNPEGFSSKNYFFPSPFLPGKKWIDLCDDESDYCTPFPFILKFYIIFIKLIPPRKKLPRLVRKPLQ